MVSQSLLPRVPMASPLRTLTSIPRYTSLSVTTRNSRRVLSPTPLPIRRPSTNPPILSAVQRRDFSVSPLSLASIVHPDTDTLIRYSLLHGPPRTPRAKIYKTNLTVRPPTMGAAALEHRVLDEVARHIIGSHHRGSCRKAARHVWGSRPTEDEVFKATNRGPHTGIDMKARSPTGSSENETHGSTGKTAVHYHDLLALVCASALMGYLIRGWNTGTRPGEGGGSE
ncbi:hypothetical protein LZ30DRAFT_608603 [Colletotrichum cereale]|nr:hypothetical protein LZ30DRAFT_608603 [Colletotrichum cereale]